MEMQPEQRDVNAEILEELRQIKAGVALTNGRVTALEAWRAEHQPWSEKGRDLIVAIDTKIDRLSVDVVSRVSGTLQAMVHDALNSAMREDFAALYREEAENDRMERRKERREDMKSLLTRTQRVAIFIVPFLMIVNVVGQWFNWW